MEFLEVDGSLGEGGGQILRTAVAFSAIKKRPVRVVRVRAGREVPGLRRQHASTLRVLQEVFGGEMTGAAEGSSEVTFVPGKPRLSRLSLDMGTAASITLVLQAVVPAAALSGHALSLDLVGGTDVPWSPTFDHFATVARGAYAAIGIVFRTEASRRGYYPRGGGRVSAAVTPSAGVRPVNLIARPDAHRIRVVSRCGMLPGHVAQRQLEGARSTLGAAGYAVDQADASVEESDSPGSSVLVSAVEGGEFLGCDSLGQKGRAAEVVGDSAAEAMLATFRSAATLDNNTADMVLPLLSLGAAPSKARVPSVSRHLETGLAVAELFTSCRYRFEESGGCWTVEVRPADV